jgi:hypothetical protein
MQQHTDGNRHSASGATIRLDVSDLLMTNQYTNAHQSHVIVASPTLQACQAQPRRAPSLAGEARVLDIRPYARHRTVDARPQGAAKQRLHELEKVGERRLVRGVAGHHHELADRFPQRSSLWRIQHLPGGADDVMLVRTYMEADDQQLASQTNMRIR